VKQDRFWVEKGEAFRGQFSLAQKLVIFRIFLFIHAPPHRIKILVAGGFGQTGK
jgi:hypothetical protein